MLHHWSEEGGWCGKVKKKSERGGSRRRKRNGEEEKSGGPASPTVRRRLIAPSSTPPSFPWHQISGDAATMTSSSETGSTNNSTSAALFDVFLSFRGPDTRANFTDTLYYALLDKGISVFIDKKGIDVGEEIGPEIFQAIDDSKICIPILSRGYASSSWCLRELEHTMKRRKTNELMVMPIFYDVEPSDVKLETELYKHALTLHKEKHGAEVVQRWEEALREVTRIRGWDTKNTGHGKLTRQIALDVFGKLKVSPVRLSDPLVGIGESVDKVIDMLSVGSKDVKLIGICGIGGIGKTTLAKAVYNKLSTHFQSCSFILNIRQASKSSSAGLLDVQRQLVHDILGEKKIEIRSIDEGKNMIEKRFSEKEVLIFLDDLNDGQQLRALAAERKWFGLGSRIVVTTRDKNILSVFEKSLTYEVEGLNSEESLELFSKHAFGSNFPPSDFLSLSKKVAAKTGGLPLTIEVISSLLRGKERTEWKEILKKMEKYPHKDVVKHLMLSYEALDGTQRQIFLDVACFLAGKNKRDATYVWDDCQLFPKDGIQVLLSMSLVKIGMENELWMHDQLKDLGRSIVLAENEKDPGKRSRVWNHGDALDMITKKKGTETVEAICVDFNGISWASKLKKAELIHRSIMFSLFRRVNSCRAIPEPFKIILSFIFALYRILLFYFVKVHGIRLKEVKKMPNIRFLEIMGGNLIGDFKGTFSKLKWLSWKDCPSSLKATNFCPKELLILDLSRTDITQDWNGWTKLKVATRLKVLNLSHCKMLSATPDLSAYLSLEILILEDCIYLEEIDRSIGHLRCLKHLNLHGCNRLRVLPIELGSLEALTELLISYKETETYLRGDTCLLREVPSSIGALMNLERLVICGSHNLTKLPDSIGKVKTLAELDISDTGITELPNTIVNLKSLKVLKITSSHMKKLPEGIGMLEKLERIHGEYCNYLEMIPGDIGRLPFLTVLKLTRTLVENVPELPQSLEILCLSSRVAGKAPEISNLVRLSHLQLSFGHKSIGSIDKETYSPFCQLELPSITSLSPYLGCLCCLKELVLTWCDNLRHTGQLPSSLRKLTIRDWGLLEVVDLSNLENLLELTLETEHVGIQVLEDSTSLQLCGLERMENLRCLQFEWCTNLQTLPNLSILKNLKHLTLSDCKQLVEIEGLDKLESLESLSIECCDSLRSLPDLSHLKKLKTYWLDGEQVV